MSRYAAEFKKAVLISKQHKWCELIASNKKTVEIRTTRPKENTPFKAYIYESLGKRIVRTGEVPGCGGGIFIDYVKYEGRGKVIGEYICDRIDTYEIEGYDKALNVYQAIKKIEYDEVTDDIYQYTEASNDMSQEELSRSSLLNDSCLSFDEIGRYVVGKKEFGFHTFYGWHISNLIIYDKPKDLREFELLRAPQSWCYVKDKCV